MFDYATSLEEVYVDNCVVEIAEGAFANNINLTRLELPFVGQNKDSNETESGVLGWLFSTECDKNHLAYMAEVEQEYAEELTRTSFIPKSLEYVNVYEASHINYGTFDQCTMIEVIDLPLVT